MIANSQKTVDSLSYTRLWNVERSPVVNFQPDNSDVALETADLQNNLQLIWNEPR